MSQKLPVNNFWWIEYNSQFNKDFIKTINFFEVGIQYPEKLHELHNDLLFLPEKMKIQKVKKLVSNLYDKTKCIIHLRNLKQALNHGLVFNR